MTTYRLFRWKGDDLENLGQQEDIDGEFKIGAIIRLEWENDGVDQESEVKVLEILEPNPRKISRDDGTVYEPEPVAIVEEV